MVLLYILIGVWGTVCTTLNSGKDLCISMYVKFTSTSQAKRKKNCKQKDIANDMHAKMPLRGHALMCATYFEKLPKNKAS